jgi:hypothetical protein
VSYSEEEVLAWIYEYEKEWSEDNQISTLAFAPKKRALTPYMLFATSERKKLPNGGKGVKIADTAKHIGREWAILPEA